jgi:hypothetical protein
VVDDNTLKEIFKKSLETKPSTKEELKNWIYLFLGLDLPDSHLDGEDSNGSPMEAIWESYDTYRLNKGDEHPGYIWLSSRDGAKTLSASILAVVLMVFFDSTICWLASIEPQSKIALNNVQSFISKIMPYINYCGKNVQSNNARNLEIVASNGERSLINILVATMASVNGRHVNCVFCDETDLLRDPRVLDEVQAVASLIGGQFPLKLYFSTRKFAFGNMEQLIQKKESLGLKLVKWDILDVTEYCPPSRHKPSEPKVKLFIHPEPPLRHLTPEDHANLSEVEQKQYQELEVFSGCSGCKLVSQCKTRLAKRNPNDKGMLWKKIDHTINMFRSMSPDMATAQLLCRKPSQSGLVYPRFDETGNTYAIEQAYYNFTGERAANLTIDHLVQALHNHGIDFYVGGDWGSTACQAFVISAIMPGGEWWIVDSYAIPGLEFDDVLKLGMKIRDTYRPKKWFMDTNQPMFIKAFNKNGMRCAEFKKDVMGGIECVRAQVINSAGIRKLRVIKHERTQIMLEGFRKHHFILDSLGKPTDSPDDGEAWSDVMDSTRYLGQNLFAAKSTSRVVIAEVDGPGSLKIATEPGEQIRQEILNRSTDRVVDQNGQEKTRKKKGLAWDI